MKKLTIILIAFLMSGICYGQQEKAIKINYVQVVSFGNLKGGNTINVIFGSKEQDSIFQAIRPKKENGEPRKFENDVEVLEILSGMDFECFSAFVQEPAKYYICKRKAD